MPIKIISESYSAQPQDELIGVICEFTPVFVELPAPGSAPVGKTYVIKDISNDAAVNNITVYTADQSLIDTERYQIINQSSAAITVINLGQSWSIIATSGEVGAGGNVFNPMTANLNADGFQVTNLPVPSFDTDASTKKYVDDNLLNKVTNPMGAELSANGFKITNLSDPASNQDAATKKYVDDNSGGSGDVTNPMDVQLDAGGFKIVNLAAPAADQDAATKKYVDDNAGGTGNVSGPPSSTNRGVGIFDGTAGDALLSTSVVIDISGNIVTTGLVDGRDVSADGAALDTVISSVVTLSSSVSSLSSSVVSLSASVASLSFSVSSLSSSLSSLSSTVVSISTRTPTTDQKAALAGTNGTPSALNPYVTDSDPRLTAGTVTNPLSANLDANGFKITNLLNPTSDQDAATKKYVDDNAGPGGTGNSYFPGGWG